MAAALSRPDLTHCLSCSTDHFIDSLIRLSFETCFAPAFFSVLSASLYASFYNKGDLWNVSDLFYGLEVNKAKARC